MQQQSFQGPPSVHAVCICSQPHWLPPAGAFTAAISLARRVFDIGAALGFSMDLLDIGGGFCGGNFDEAGNVDLGGVPHAVNSALEEFFPEGSGVRVIAEPGRCDVHQAGVGLHC